MNLPTFDSLDDAFRAGLKQVLKFGDEVAPRKLITKEVTGFGFRLQNPRNRLTLNPARKWSLPFAIGEFCWHSSGSDEVDDISYYAKSWSNFSEDGRRIYGSCYGRKIFSSKKCGSQWENLIQLLKADSETRRAVLYFDSYMSKDLLKSVDVSCTAHCQFLIRNHKLHCFVSMRSNDAMWGLPYDVFFFSMLQERLAFELEIELGTYTHFATSFHIYERHFKLAEEVLGCANVDAMPMPAMADLHTLPSFLRNESQIRGQGMLNSCQRLAGYWGELEDVLLFHARRRQASITSDIHTTVRNPLYAKSLSYL